MTTQFLDKALSLQNLFLGAIAESYLVVKLLPDYVPQGNPLVWVLIRVLAANIGVFCIFWGLIYPYAFSPIRHFPTVNVR
jgi:hypothetical protein